MTTDLRATPGAATPREPAAGRSGGDAPDPGGVGGTPWFWRFGFPAALVVLVLLVPVLVLAGREVVLHSNEGVADTRVTDPAAPDFQALTDPTPTLLVVGTDAQGSLEGVTVLSLANDTAGGVLFIPADTSPAPGQPTMRAIAASGTDAVRDAVETAVGASMGETTEVPRDAWTDLVAPVAPITVENPDDVYVGTDGSPRLRFPRGTVTLAAADVPDYLFATGGDVSPLTLLVRHRAFWSGWLAAVAGAEGDDAVPGERDTGLGRFVRALAADRAEMATLPVQKVPIPGSTAAIFLPDPATVPGAVARLIPFPVGSPPGSRVRIALLDGTGTLDHGLVAAPVLVGANGQIDLVGNAPAFGRPTTRLAYRDEARRAEVERLRDALGVGELELTTTTGGSADVTITLGQDYVTSGTRAAPSTPANGG